MHLSVNKWYINQLLCICVSACFECELAKFQFTLDLRQFRKFRFEPQFIDYIMAAVNMYFRHANLKRRPRTRALPSVPYKSVNAYVSLKYYHSLV